MRHVPDELVSRSIELPSGELHLLQPHEAASLPDAGAVEWAPITPYWSVLWRSGVALACELDGVALRGLGVLELGCGLAVPSIAAARAGGRVTATDWSPAALELLEVNARRNDAELEPVLLDWRVPAWATDRAPWDLVLAADILY